MAIVFVTVVIFNAFYLCLINFAIILKQGSKRDGVIGSTPNTDSSNSLTPHHLAFTNRLFNGN